MKIGPNSVAEKQAEFAEALSFCKGVKLLYVKEKVRELLSYIGRNGVFDKYSLHAILTEHGPCKAAPPTSKL